MAQQGIQTENRRTAPCLERQSSRARASLPPLAIGRRSLQEWPKAASDDVEVSGWAAPATPGQRRAKTGPDVKLDLAFVPRAPLDSDTQLKRDKFAFYDKECSRVANYHIYLGSDAVAKNKDTLKAHGITHVLNCVGFVCPEYFKKDFFYKTLWLQDSPGEDITSLLYDVFDYFEEVGELGGRVFVHCCQGVSRSTSFVIAYMMWRECRSFEDAFHDVKASRGVTNPNMGFACQLLQCQKRVHAAPMSPTSVLRMYRLAPYSPYDPLHLVPKAVDNPSPAALDSRGAFVIHVPVAIFVWIGSDCDLKIAQAARAAAAQVVRYERTQGSVHIIVEGAETDDFWDSLGKYADLLDDADSHELDANSCELVKQKKRAGQTQLERARKVSAGERIVPAYSPDFELYQRARQGGVVPPVPSTGAGMIGAPTRIPEREDGWSVLRRKFLSGELFPTREMAMSDLSPASSKAISSPLFSPISYATTGSGGDSVSASPLSQLSILSPATPSSDLTDLSEGCGSRRSSASLQNPDDHKAFHRMQLPCLGSRNVNDNATGSKAMDESDGICMENERNDMEMVDTSSEESCAWEGILEAGHPVLYAWPQFKRIDYITADCFRSSKDVLVLAVPQQAVNRENPVIYVWVGRELYDQAGDLDSPWQQVGHQFLKHLKCRTGTQIRVVKQGGEPDELLVMSLQ
ncbi:hypothetical protein GOP47_0020301 [Adiantum capillus-veneris]|uniref:Protein-tyrosine-phosphatase MKP1 n=1 Tax=Adiantum capillus-veneris TaxID=13818 RepID=A0A9D4ZAH3_ADICA|nr:hypothetical protein GOP47_0020301 [Adiantum capillus-veneris]